MPRQTGGHAVVDALIAHGVRVLYGLPGIQNDWLYNALYDHRDRIQVIHTRHEQGAGFMALGQALATGQPAVFNVVPGPGLLNATAALATAYGLCAPVVCLTGQIPSHQIGRGIGVLHEIPDQLGILRSLTKWAARVDHPAEIPEQVAQAFHQARSGCPRPVGLEVPMDVLQEEAQVTASTGPRPPWHPPVDEDRIDQAARILGQAENPILFVGGGAQGAGPLVTELAEMLQAPVVAYRTGHGVVDGRHPLSLFLPPAHEYWKKADAALAIGSNMRIPLGQWGVDEGLKILRIDVDPASHHRIRRPDVAITARAEDALPRLLERLPRYNRVRPARTEEMQALKGWWARQIAYLEPQLSFLRVIREELGEEGIFVDELTQVGFVSRIAMPAYRPRTFISCGYQGTLGYGFPTALGVKVARPEVPVLSITGDGGFLFTGQELATAVQHRIALVTVIFDNRQYGNVQQMQRTLYGGRVIATDLHNPDFVALAQAFGAQGLRATTPEELRSALRRAFATDHVPTLIQVPVGDMPTVDRFRNLPRVR